MSARVPAAELEPPADVAPTSDDEPPNWPDESAEAAFLAETRAAGVPTSAAPEVESGKSPPLPPLDELVQRVPPEVREALDELFRARFVTVKRVPKTALK